MTTPTRYGTSCAPREDGVFVHFTEYEKVVAECERLRVDNDSLMSALADCREAAFDEGFENPHLIEAVGDPLSVPAYVAYAFEWLAGMLDISKTKEKA